MGPEELAARASRVYGPEWQTKLASALQNLQGGSVSLRTVQRWAAKGVSAGSSGWVRDQLAKIEALRPADEFAIKTYLAFKSGARLRSNDVADLLAAGGLPISANRLRELGRVSDRARPITARELYILVSMWALSQPTGGRPCQPMSNYPQPFS